MRAMTTFTIEEDDRKAIEGAVSDLAKRYTSIEDSELLHEGAVYAQELPRKLRAAINAFRLKESTGVLSIIGYRIEDALIGPTPKHWKDQGGPSRTILQDVFFLLCSAVLGDPIGWATQQDGRIMHDVAPIQGHEKEQLGSGSEELLTWHTEDAFHPLRTDYVGLMCLRNPDGVATTYASVDDLRLPDDVAAKLREARYPIRPDRSHLPKNVGGSRDIPAEEQELLRRSYEWITRLDKEPERCAVLFGDPASPYLRIDPFFMQDVYADKGAGSALDEISAGLDCAMVNHVLQPGEIFFLDNFKVVHGRLPFKARYDGTDRWLKRLNIVRDMRKSRARRLGPAARVIY